jgi:transcriptional regulator with XRE-family HTH domain
MADKISAVLGSKIKEAREKADLSLEDLAKQACLSTKQLEQIEDGGDSYFYSAAIKFTSAKRIAKILGLTEDSTFKT